MSLAISKRLEKFIGALGPGEVLGGKALGRVVMIDGLLEVVEPGESLRTGTAAILGNQVGDLVKPRLLRGRTKLKTGAPLDPVRHRPVFEGGAIVRDHENIKTHGRLAIHPSQKLEERGVALVAKAAPNNIRIEGLQCCRERLPPATLRNSGQFGLAAVRSFRLRQRFDLENKSPVRWVNVDPDHVL